MSILSKKAALLLSIILLSVSTSISAEVELKDVLETKLKSGFDCFNPDAIRNWNIVDDKNLIISTNKKRETYLLRFFRPCLFLEMSNAIKLVSKKHLVCHNDFAVIVDIGSSEQCKVRIIEQLDATLVKNLFDTNRKDAKSNKTKQE